MHDAEAVRVIERIGHLRDDVGDGGERQTPAAHHVLQALAFKKLHRDEGYAGVFAELIDGDDIGVIEAAGRFRFAQKTLFDFSQNFLRQLGVERLERDRTLDRGVEAVIHRAHRAAAELGDDLVAAELFQCGRRSGRFSGGWGSAHVAILPCGGSGTHPINRTSTAWRQYGHTLPVNRSGPDSA